MTAISAPDLAILRYPYRRVSNLKINVPTLETVATAEVLNSPAAYPTAQIDTTSETTWNFADRDLFVRITNGSTLRYEGGLRVDATTGVLPIAGIVEGDTGIARRVISTPQTGDDVSVYNLPIPVSYLNRIDSGGTFYKLWDVPFTGQTSTPRPQANIGTDQQATVATGATAEFTLDASGSYSWNGNSLNYQWNLPTGVTLVSGTLADATITVDAVEGNHAVWCQVTDSVTTQFNRGWRRLYVNSPSVPAFGDNYAITGLSINHRRDGMQVSFDITSDGQTVKNDDIFLGQQVCITWNYEFSQDGETWVQPSEASLYRKTVRSWVKSWTTTQDADNVQVTNVQAVDIVSYVDDLILASQVMIRDDTPSRWVEVPTAFMNLAGYMQYVIDWHCSAIFKLCDFDYGDLNTVTFPDFKISAGSVGDAIRQVQRYVPGSSIAQSPEGTLKMRRGLSYELTAYRDALPIRMDVEDQDVIEQISYNQRQYKLNFATESGCFVDAVPIEAYRFRRALSAPQQGKAKATIPDFIATSETNGQWYVGQHHARENSDVQSITYNTFIDAYDVAERDVVNLTITDPRSETITNSTRAEIAGNNWTLQDNGDVNHSVTFDVETLGGYAETIPLDPASYVEFTAPKNPTEPDDGSSPTVPSRYTWNFTARQGGWLADFNGTWVAGQGWRTDDPGFLGNSTFQIYNNANPSTSTNVTQLECKVVLPVASILEDDQNNPNQIALFSVGGVSNVNIRDVAFYNFYYPDGVFTNPWTEYTFIIPAELITDEGGENFEQIYFQLYFPGSVGVIAYVQSITIYYEGDMNFQTRTT